MHVCPECGKKIATAGGLEIHGELAHRATPPVVAEPEPSFVVVVDTPPTRPASTPLLRGYDPTLPLTALLVLALLLAGIAVALHRTSTPSVRPPGPAVVVSQS
jgi:hypothetical protein